MVRQVGCVRVCVQRSDVRIVLIQGLSEVSKKKMFGIINRHQRQQQYAG